MNDSLLFGSVPWQFKEAVVTPLLKKKKKKKDGLDANSLLAKYVSLVSNPSFLFEALEKVMLHRLRSHLSAKAID